MLGVGMGWHRHESDFMGVEFKGRGPASRRGDPADTCPLERRARFRKGSTGRSTTRPRSRTRRRSRRSGCGRELV